MEKQQKPLLRGKALLDPPLLSTKFGDQNCQKESFHIEEGRINST
jgi:hypothetical protein